MDKAVQDYRWGDHLCGYYYGTPGIDRCEHHKHVLTDNEMYGKRKLEKGCSYCMAEGRCRKLGNPCVWTGCSPTWCPKRQARKETSNG